MHREALGGVIDEHLGHEVEAGGVKGGEHESQVLGRPLRELVPVLSPPQHRIWGGYTNKGVFMNIYPYEADIQISGFWADMQL